MMTVQAAFFFFARALHPKSGSLRQTIGILLVGTVFGIVFDLVVGKYLGVFEYRLGFDGGFLFVNGLFSYGLMASTVYLLRRSTFLRFYFWTELLASVYEIGNVFFPVWRWTFASSSLVEEAVLIGAAYCGLAMLMGIALQYGLGVGIHWLRLSRARNSAQKLKNS